MRDPCTDHVLWADAFYRAYGAYRVYRVSRAYRADRVYRASRVYRFSRAYRVYRVGVGTMGIGWQKKCSMVRGQATRFYSSSACLTSVSWSGLEHGKLTAFSNSFFSNEYKALAYTACCLSVGVSKLLVLGYCHTYQGLRLSRKAKRHISELTSISIALCARC